MIIQIQNMKMIVMMNSMWITVVFVGQSSDHMKKLMTTNLIILDVKNVMFASTTSFSGMTMSNVTFFS